LADLRRGLNSLNLDSDVVDLRYVKSWILLDQRKKFDISNVSIIRLQKYKDYSIRVCGECFTPSNKDTKYWKRSPLNVYLGIVTANELNQLSVRKINDTLDMFTTCCFGVDLKVEVQVEREHHWPAKYQLARRSAGSRKL